MVAGSCCSSIRTFRICLLQNWKMTRNQFGWKCLQTKLLILWQVGIDRLVALVIREQLDNIRTHHKGKKLPSVHVLADFNFKDIDWPDRLSKSGSTLSQSMGQILIDIMNDHGLEQMVHFPTREKNTLDLIHTALPGQFQDVHAPDKLSDHDTVSGTLKIFIPPIKKPRRKVYIYQKGHYESMRKDTFEFAKEKYFNGHSDTRSVQENFDLLTSFIQDSADKHIPSKTSRSVSSIPWITPEIRRKIRRKNKTHAKAKKTGNSKLRSKFETLRREIKADVRKQHDLYVNNLVGDVKANPRDFHRYIKSQKKDIQGIPPLKKKNGKGVAQSDLEKAEEFNGQFTDVFNKNEHTQVPLLDRSAPFMNDIAVSKDGVIKLLKGLNPSKALGPDELHPSPKGVSNRVRSGICSSFSAINWHWWNPKGMVSCKYLPPFQEEW